MTNRMQDMLEASGKDKGVGLRVIIAAGGTGGHLFPGIAIGQAFMERHPDSRVLFVSVGKNFEKSALEKAGFPLECITSAAFKGRGICGKLEALGKVPKGIRQSIGVLRRFAPHLVIGLGSYTSAPMILSAWMMGIPVGLHEQNIVPGMTNRTLAPIADRIYVSFSDTRISKLPWLARKLEQRTCFSGNPVRQEIIRQAGYPRQSGGPDKNPYFTVLVVGGSQGAHGINTAMMAVAEHLTEKDRFFFIHQAGPDDEEQIRRIYHTKNIACLVRPFFDDMAQHYHRSDLVVCRAGASTVAEITALGKGAIFIPYPYAADDHQAKNAGTLAEAGAAEVILQRNLDGAILARRIEYYADHPLILREMAEKAKYFGRPDAAMRIVEDCCALLDAQGRKPIHRI